jgi:RHS repeat-associated protein
LTEPQYRYTGKPLDEEFDLNLHYYGARYVSAPYGRFTQIDPLRGKYPSWSPYVYTLDNPLKFVDPDGRAAAAEDNPLQTITEGAVQKLADLGAKLDAGISFTVKVGMEVGAKLGLCKATAGASVSYTTSAGGGKQTVKRGVEARAAVGNNKATAGLSTNIVGEPQATVGLDVGNGQASMGAEYTVNREGGEFSSSLDVEGGDLSAGVTSPSDYSFGASLGVAGAEITVNPVAAQAASAPPVKHALSTLRSVSGLTTPTNK